MLSTDRAASRRLTHGIPLYRGKRDPEALTQPDCERKDFAVAPAPSARWHFFAQARRCFSVDGVEVVTVTVVAAGDP